MRVSTDEQKGAENFPHTLHMIGQNVEEMNVVTGEILNYRYFY